MISNRRRLPAFFMGTGWFLITYVVLVILYSSSTPLFEAPDAYYHFAVIDYIANEGELPPKTNPQAFPWRQMTFHAPLYHMISAALIAPIDTDDFLIRYPLNPHARIGVPDAETNHNFVAHTGDPWVNTGLAVRLVRAFSMVCGAVTLFSVYRMAVYLLPADKRRYAYLAVALVLFNPQFLYLSGVVNNDNLVIALTTASLTWMLHILKTDLNWRNLMILALLLALNSLAKASGLAVYPVAMILMAYVCWRDHVPFARTVLYGIAGILTFALIAGWWYLTNWLDFGDPTGGYQVAKFTQLRSEPIDVVGEMRGLYYSFWALFGWFNIRVTDTFYNYVTVLLTVAVIGVFFRLPRLRRTTSDQRFILVALLIFVVIFLLSWWRFNTLVQAAQGRLWFPMVGILATAAAYGLAQWRQVGRMLIIPMAFFCVLFPVKYLYQVYSPTPQTDQRPQNVTIITFREPWRDSACAELVITSPARIEGHEIVISHSWGARCPVTGYWSVFAHVSDLSAETCETGNTSHILSQFDSMPDGGKIPLPALQVGYRVPDEIRIPLPDGLGWSDSTALQMGLYDAGGTFIRAFVDEIIPGEGQEVVSIGRCSPELVNIAIVDN